MSVQKILALPRSLLINLYLFGIKGLEIPILISNKTKLKGIRRENVIVLKPAKFCIQIGFGGTEGVIENRYSILKIEGNGRVLFGGVVHIGAGSSIRIDAGTFYIGNDFYCNKNCFFSCSESIKIGDHVLLGWNVSIRDSDGHTIIQNGVRREPKAEVNIGDHVWIASNVNVLKGVAVGRNSVVAYGSCLTKVFKEEKCLIGGIPGKVIKKNIEWEK